MRPSGQARGRANPLGLANPSNAAGRDAAALESRSYSCVDPKLVPVMRNAFRPLLTAVLLLALVACTADGNGEEAVTETGNPAPAPTTKLATFGGGCFWCTEAVFVRIDGVFEVTSGYTGGEVEDPTYEQICGGETGHAEAIQMRYDPAKVAYTDLLEIFFSTHDPTTLNRQGPDVGTQYRSAVFYHDEEQRAVAERVRKALDESGIFPSPIVTESTPATRFWPAEKYHQDYYENNSSAGYCVMVIRPKLEKLTKLFREKLKDR